MGAVQCYGARAGDVVQFIDAHGRIMWCSPAVKRVLGYEPDAFLGRGGFEVVHPDDQEATTKTLMEVAAHDLRPGDQIMIVHWPTDPEADQADYDAEPDGLVAGVEPASRRDRAGIMCVKFICSI